MADVKHAPDSLKYQWHLYGLVSRSDWATSLDKSVAYEIIDRYMKKYGNSRTALTYLCRATGATRTNIVASTRRLVAHGPFSVIRRGAGTRPTEYRLHFEALDEIASSLADGTTGTTNPTTHHHPDQGGVISSSSPAGGTPVVLQAGPLDKASSPVHGTQSVLHVPAYMPGYVEGTDNESAVAAPPPAPPPQCGAGGVVPADDFEQLWAAYGYRQKKADARDVWTKLAPPPDMAARIIEAAGIWRHAWNEGGGAKTGRRTLGMWLKREEYDCDPPTRREKATSNRGTPSNDNSPENGQTPVKGPARPLVRHSVKITSADVSRGSTGDILRVVMTDEDGQEYEKIFRVQDHSPSEQEKGQKRLTRLLQAFNQNSVEDEDELIGREIKIAMNAAGDIAFVPHPDMDYGYPLLF